VDYLQKGGTYCRGRKKNGTVKTAGCTLPGRLENTAAVKRFSGRISRDVKIAHENCYYFMNISVFFLFCH